MQAGEMQHGIPSLPAALSSLQLCLSSCTDPTLPPSPRATTAGPKSRPNTGVRGRCQRSPTVAAFGAGLAVPGCEQRAEGGSGERWVSCCAGGLCRALQHSLTYFLGRYSHTSHSGSAGFLFSSTTYRCLLTNWQWDHSRVPSVPPPRSTDCPLPHLQPVLLPLNGCPPFPTLSQKIHGTSQPRGGFIDRLICV